MAAVYIANQDAVEAMHSIFGTLPFNKTKTWGWIVELRVWEFRVQVSSMAGATRAIFEQESHQPNGGSVFITKRAWEDIKHPDDIFAVMREIKAILLGIAAALLQFCGDEKDVS